jgi:hypothetical protein
MRRLFARTALALSLLLAAAPAFAGTTWNPSDRDASIILSNGNLTATSSVSGWHSVRGTTSYTVGTNHKVIFFLSVSSDSVGGWIGGLGNSAMSLTSYVGATGVSAGLQINNTGGVYSYSAGGATGPACQPDGGNFANGLYVAVDFNTGKIWCDPDCQFGGTYDPDTGTNNTGTIPSGTTVFIAWSGYTTTPDATTLNPAPSLAACTLVSTFTTWDATPPVGGSGELPLLGVGDMLVPFAAY